MPRAAPKRAGTDRPVVKPAHCEADPSAKAEVGLASSQRRHVSSRPRTAGRRRGTGTWQVHSTAAQDCSVTQSACPGAAGRHPCRRRAGSRDRGHSGGRVHDGEEGQGQSTTFNVLYGADRNACYEGTGEITARVGAVFAISRGEHRLELTHGTSSRIVNLASRMKIAFSPADQWKFVLIDITRTWRATRGSPIGGGDAFVRTVSEQSPLRHMLGMAPRMPPRQSRPAPQPSQ